VCLAATAIAELAINIFNYIRNIFYPTAPPAPLAPTADISLEYFNKIIQEDQTPNAITLTLPLREDIMSDVAADLSTPAPSGLSLQADRSKCKLVLLITNEIIGSKNDFLHPHISYEVSREKKPHRSDPFERKQDEVYYAQLVKNTVEFACKERPIGSGIEIIEKQEKWDRYEKLYQERKTKVVIKWSTLEDLQTALEEITPEVKTQVSQICTHFRKSFKDEFDERVELSPSHPKKSLRQMQALIARQ
jgi:hypothetical protein